MGCPKVSLSSLGKVANYKQPPKSNAVDVFCLFCQEARLGRKLYERHTIGGDDSEQINVTHLGDWTLFVPMQNQDESAAHENRVRVAITRKHPCWDRPLIQHG